MTQQTDNSRLPGIDGLKAVAALFIMFGHVIQKDFAVWNAGTPRIPFPFECVTLFFLISGFLTTASSDRAGSFSPLAFYRKKAARILPTYYLYLILASVACIILHKWQYVSSKSVLWYVFAQGEFPFAMGNGLLPFVHLWYIGVLVVFYLVAPLVLRLDRSKQILVFSSACIGWFIIKLIVFLIMGKCALYRIVATFRVEPLMLGSLLGIMIKPDKTKCQSIMGSRVVFILCLCGFLFSGLYALKLPAVVRPEFFTAQYSFLLFSVVSVKHNLMDNKVMTWLGHISYPLYVCHPLVLIIISVFIESTGWIPDTFGSRLLTDLLAVAVSLGMAYIFSKSVKILTDKYGFYNLKIS